MNFWQDHSVEYLEMAFTYDHMERLEKPDGYGIRKGDCGDTVEFFLMEKNGAIDHISYYIDGCKNTNACANTVVKMADRMKIAEAWDITPEAVADYLKTLPEHEIHCAELATGAFYLALKDLQSKKEGCDA